MSEERSCPVLRVKAQELYGWAWKMVRQEYPEKTEEEQKNIVALHVINAIQAVGGPSLSFHARE